MNLALVRTLLLGEVDSIFLSTERKARALHVIRTARGPSASTKGRMGAAQDATHELAHPIKGFSQRPPPCKTSQSILHWLDLPEPLWVVLRVGWKILTAR